MGKKSLVIGITGGTGVGKTRLVHHLNQRLKPNKLTIVNQDNYYKPIQKQPVDENGIENFDTLESIDAIKMENDLKLLLKGESFKQQVYHFNMPNKEKTYLEIKPAPLIIIEGLFALSFPEIFDLTHMSIFVEASEDLMLQRRIDRDFKERGYDQDDVTYRFYKHFMPAYKQHVLPLKSRSTHLLTNNGEFETAINTLETQIMQEIDFLN